MRMKHSLLAAASLAMLSTTASAVDFGGYTRIGPGQKQPDRCADGGGAAALGSQAPGHGGIGRLGNECNTYGEFALSQGMEAGGVKYKALIMTNFFSGGSVPATDDANTPRVNQLYVSGKGFDVFPQGNFWVGRRFYHRADVHFDDSFYVYGGMQGSTGAGVDEIPVAGGTLGIGVWRNGDQALGNNPGSLLSIDLEGLPVNPGGKLRVIASFSKFSGTGGKSGSGITLQHNQSGLLGGENTAWFQYSQGSTWLDMGFAGGTQDSSYKRWRIADAMAWLNGPLTGQALFHYGQAEQPNGLGGKVKSKTTSIAGRVAYALTKNFKIQGELGTASTKPDGGGSQTVTKFTVAPTLAIGPNYYDRPELRFYVSTFNMNEAYRVTNGYSKKTKTAAGIQAEIWF